ncbi:MAG: rRNA maturation RNase YbeY [Candidatus Geothermincolales bacterium]
MKVLVNNLSQAELDEESVSVICERILRAEGAPPSTVVSVTAVDEGQMADLNLSYTGREGCTDVLSFPMGEKDGKDYLLGDVIICPMEVERRAKEYDVPPGMELSYVVAHGLLHLMGYRDDTEEGWNIMDLKVRQFLDIGVEGKAG